MKINNRSTFSLSLKSSSGQVALFLALIFQILFLFFAMIINVGLLVHHKINLQNSVDFAAYYGASKQAENMNVIAHTNYQIRQSWKLLSWRYRMLGSAGDFNEHPFNKTTRGFQGPDVDDINPSNPKFYEAPAFCITYIPFKPMPPSENTCKDIARHSGIKIFRVPNVGIDLPGISNATRNVTQALQGMAFNRCRDFGAFNYIMLGGFMVSYNIDQGARSLFMASMANQMSPANPSDDFYDIDGESVITGMRKTFLNNLTDANRASSPEFKTYNSLGDSNCNSVGVPENMPAKWLRPIRIAPGFTYVDTKCNVGGNLTIGTESRTLDSAYGNVPFHYQSNGQIQGDNPVFTRQIAELKQWIRIAVPPLDFAFNFSIGVEKSPYCMAYMGVSATATPKIPFSPFGSIQLKARGFAKPFGGKIGPWYGKRWDNRQGVSSAGADSDRHLKTDKLLPPRVIDLGNLGREDDPTRAANYSRFVGDDVGLMSRRVLYEYGRSIYGLDPSWKPLAAGGENNNAVDYGDSAPNFDHWSHLPFGFSEIGGSQDSLAWDHKQNAPSRMRELEMSAILPDAFDMAYYSIEPNFYGKYYKRLKNGYLAKAGQNYFTGKYEFLGDIGTHKGFKSGDVNLDEFSVIDQYKVVKNSEHIRYMNLDLQNRLAYISTLWEDVLTGWTPKSLTDFSLDADRLGRCRVYPTEVDGGSFKHSPVPTSGNCVAGGGSGYYVKMISSDSLKRTIPNIGGEGVGGTILNPPPDDF